jgi:hypothetical protein
MCLPGASVLVSGTNIGTSTDLDGQFSINNVDKMQLWYLAIQVMLHKLLSNGQTSLNVSMKSDL